jgi:hypothetical protein
MPGQSMATSNLASEGNRGRVVGIPGPDVPFQLPNQPGAGGMPYRTGTPERDERFKQAMGLPTGGTPYTDATRPDPMASANPTVRNRAIAGPARTPEQAPAQQAPMTPTTPAPYTNDWQRPPAATGISAPSSAVSTAINQRGLTAHTGPGTTKPGIAGAYSVPLDRLTEPDPNRALSAIMAARGGLRG